MKHVILALACVLIAVSSAAEEAKPAASVIESGLRSLIAREKSSDAFVIFTDAKSGSFIQFTYEDKALWIDIPLSEKSAREKKQLERIFASIGVLRPQITSARDSETKKPFIVRAYQASFGGNVKSAAAFGVRVFDEAFELKSPSLTVETEETDP